MKRVIIESPYFSPDDVLLQRDLGVSAGMRLGIQQAYNAQHPIVVRTLHDATQSAASLQDAFNAKPHPLSDPGNCSHDLDVPVTDVVDERALLYISGWRCDCGRETVPAQQM